MGQVWNPVNPNVVMTTVTATPVTVPLSGKKVGVQVTNQGKMQVGVQTGQIVGGNFLSTYGPAGDTSSGNQQVDQGQVNYGRVGQGSSADIKKYLPLIVVAVLVLYFKFMR